MSTVETRDSRNPALLERREETSAEVAASGSAFEAVAAVATVVLAIIGLVGGWSLVLASIAGIVLGAALLLRGAAVATRFTRLLADAPLSRLSDAELGGGMSTHIVGGAAGLVLCVLAILRLGPLVLLPVAAIVFGATVLLGRAPCPRSTRLRLSTVTPARRDTAGWPARWPRAPSAPR
jgi:hypothetical protein